MMISWVTEYKKYNKNLLDRTNQQPAEFLTKKLFVRISIFILSIVLLRIYNAPKYFFVSLIIFLLEWIPVMHSSVYIIPTILYYLVEMQSNIAGAIGLLYMFLICIEQICMPYILDNKETFRPVVNGIVFLILFLLFNIVGIFIACILLTIFRAYVEIIDMKIENKKSKRRKIKS